MYLETLQQDKKLGNIIIERLDPIEPKPNIMLTLMQSIMSQQLSTKVADILHERFLTLFGTKNMLPKHVLALPVQDIKDIGLSMQKAVYIQNIARFFETHRIKNNTLNNMSDEAIIDMLTQIKGVGKWTVEMLLMFGLGRENVFSAGDYGIQVAMKKIYKLEALDKKALLQKMETLSKKWHPYKTYACRHLWNYKDHD
jgi:DNA-3-methyladenine glycosylase II